MKNPLPPKSAAGGPLTDVEKRLEDFCFNLYFSYLFTQTVSNHQELQDRYMAAWLEEDYDKMSRINRELTIVEGAFEATACMIDATKEEYS